METWGGRRADRRGGRLRRAWIVVGVTVLLCLGVGGAALAGAYLQGGGSLAGAVGAPEPVGDPLGADGAEDAAADASRRADAAELEAERARAAEERAERDRRAAEAEAEAEAAAERAAEEEARAEAEAREREARAAVTAAQQRLTELGYLVGAADGEQGQQTTAALMAFQAVNGIQVDGVLGPQTTETLAAPRADAQLVGGPATRIEVDLDRQVLHLVEGGARVVTMKVSSGNGELYTRGDGSTGRAVTPVGTFTIERRIAGVHESSAGLGTLFDPMYFLRGFAIHGSNSVPAGPASHGCIRLSRADAVWLFQRVPDGTSVVIHGGQHTFVP